MHRKNDMLNLPPAAAAFLFEKGFVAGQWIDADNEARIPASNPADASMLGCIPNMGGGETSRRSQQPKPRCRPGGRWPLASAVATSAAGGISSWKTSKVSPGG
jgi:hypothetical protein